ncbi:MAG TPA: FtsW/RodA/SpoVE family cell cycle protein, partial [Armatimonadota bacterium]
MNNTRRTTEGILLLFASVILMAGFLLVFSAKLPELRTAGTVDINTAGSGKLASALAIDSGLARLLVDYRKAHGEFASTDALAGVPLLTRKQAEDLAASKFSSDITNMSPGQLSSRAGLSASVSERLVSVLASWPEGRRISAERLSAISAVDTDLLERVDSRLRVRNPGGVILTFWVCVIMMMIGFMVLHLVLKKSLLKADPFVLPVVFLLAGLGGMILFSIKDPLRDTNVFPSQIQGIMIGILAAAIPLTAKFRGLRPWRYTYIYALAAFLLTLLLMVFGGGPGGVKLRVFGFQPVEVTKIALLYFVASYLADRWSIIADRSGPKRKMQMPLFKDIGPLLVMYVLSLAIFLLLRDLGPMLILFGMFVAMLYAATGRRIFVAVGIAAVALSGYAAYIVHMGVFDIRIDMWLHPWSNHHPNGMQLG